MKLRTLEELYDAREEANVALLIDALRDPEHRVIAAEHLGELGAREAVQPLIQLLRAKDRLTKASAADALGKIGAREAMPDLLELAQDDDDVVVRTWAVTALGAIGDKGALEPLAQLLHDEQGDVRKTAASALGDLGHPDALELLAEAAKRERWYSRRIHKESIRKISGHASRPSRYGTPSQVSEAPASRPAFSPNGRSFRKMLGAGALGALLAAGLILTGAPLWLRVVGTAVGVWVIWRFLGWTDPANWRAAWEESKEKDRERRAHGD